MDTPIRPRFHGPWAVLDSSGTPIESHPNLQLARQAVDWANDHEELCGRPRSHTFKYTAQVEGCHA